jgi:hypothetical protein
MLFCACLRKQILQNIKYEFQFFQPFPKQIDVPSHINGEGVYVINLDCSGELISLSYLSDICTLIRDIV